MSDIRDYFEDAYHANGNDSIRAFKSVLHRYGGRVGYEKECQFAERLKECSSVAPLLDEFVLAANPQYQATQ